jgi:hypothetical protein
LKEQLKKGAKSLVGDKGFLKYLRVYKNSFAIDEEKLKREQRYDGRWVL